MKKKQQQRCIVNNNFQLESKCCCAVSVCNTIAIFMAFRKFCPKKKQTNEQKQRTERLSCHSIWIDGFFKNKKKLIYLEQLVEERLLGGLIERSEVILIASNENT